MKQFFIEENTNQTKLFDISGSDAAIEYLVGKDAQLTVVITASSSENAEGKIVVKLADSGAHANIYGLLLNTGSQTIALHTIQHHSAPNTGSNLLVRCVLKDTAQITYDGAIRVDPIAQRTDAYQRNENLLLSNETKTVSRPALEILANDVRCTHGATIGTLDPDQLFYLASRGVGEQMAKQLIIDGFFESVLQKIPDTQIAEVVRKRIWQNM